MPMVEPIAAVYRGRKSIPFDDLCASGALGLTKAGRTWAESGDFRAWAYRCIEQEIQNFIRDWQPFEAPPTVEQVEEYYHWSTYRTPFEYWETLAASPEEIHIAWEDLRDARNALSGAMISLSKRERAILEARFLREPNQALESIARHHKISYWNTVKIIDRALKKLKKILRAHEQNMNANAE